MNHALLRFLTIFTALAAGLTQTSMANNSLLYVATQDPARMGIAVAEFDTDSGALSAPRIITDTRDPSHFTLASDGSRLYLCNSGTPGGVSAFAVEDRNSGALRLLNFKESKGRGPSYVSVDHTGRYMLDANYGGGFVEVYSLTQAGALDQLTTLAEFSGSSVHARQDKPYAHWIRTDPTNHFALIADLGTDRIMVFRFDVKTGKLAASEPPYFMVAAGSGPRHLAFHPNGKWVYGAMELSSEVIAMAWDSGQGKLTQFQTVKTVPADFTAPNTAAEIAVRDDGKFLYVSNRGHDSVAVYGIDARTGELTLRQHAPSRGRVPRYFTFDKSGRWFIVSNQEGGSLTVYAVDAKTGELTPKGEPVPIVKPMGVLFLN